MLITFSGLDGSGKSTQAQLVLASLQEQGHGAILLHITRWTWVNRIGEKLFTQKKRKRPSLSERLRLRLYRLTIMAVDIMRFWLFWMYVKVCGQILICDRYFYDLGIQAIYKHEMSMRLANLYWRLVPRPSVAFWLQVQPGVAQQREGEHGADYYQAKGTLYREAISHFPGINFVPAASIEETRMFIMDRVRYHMELVTGL
jgi:thymidylate kinase